MRGWLVPLVFAIVLPGGAHAQLTGVMTACSQSSELAPVNRDEDNVAAAIISAFESSDQVVVCMSGPSEESRGHGLFRLVTWEQRARVAMQLHQLPGNRYLITDIVKFNSLKAPLGWWHAVPNTVSAQASRIVEDLGDGLGAISVQYLGTDDPAEVDILSGAP